MGAELLQNVDAQHGFVGLPAALHVLCVRQVRIPDELREGGNCAQLLALLLWIGAENGFGQNSARLAPRLRHAENVGRTDLELPFAAACIAVTLVEGLTAGASDLEHEARNDVVEKIDPAGAIGARTLPNKRRSQFELRHPTSPPNYPRNILDYDLLLSGVTQSPTRIGRVQRALRPAISSGTSPRDHLSRRYGLCFSIV